MIPGVKDFWFLPLGGTGEIGMNMNLYGHDGNWLMVDCGVTFDEPLSPGEDASELVCADPTFISERKDRLAGIIITHAHEDHMGALPWLWSRFPVPVYTTPFTAELLRRKIQSNNRPFSNQIIEVTSGQTCQIGPFSVTWQATTHSLPEPQSLLITTSQGSVFHTADWKIDKKPVTGEPFNENQIRQLTSLDILAMVGDSTNALKPGHSVSENTCARGLHKLISEATGKVVVTCFATNIARLISLADIARRTGRYVALSGRSLHNSVAAARITGHWPEELAFQDLKNIGYLPDNEIMTIATGSQGEERAALARLAQDSFHDLQLDAGDTVIFSAMRIPGNEEKIDRVIEKLEGKGINVCQADDTDIPIHASGHPNVEELKAMYAMVTPRIAIPVHGEPPHLKRHGEIAKEMGIRSQLIGKNGDLFCLAPQAGIKRNKVSVGRIALVR